MERTADIAAIALVLALTAIPNNKPAATIHQCRRHTNAPVQIVRLLSLAGRQWITRQYARARSLSDTHWQRLLASHSLLLPIDLQPFGGSGRHLEVTTVCLCPVVVSVSHSTRRLSMLSSLPILSATRWNCHDRTNRSS
jgi:hypothetical protein